MGKKDDRLFIRMHIGMPEHPKVEGLSDKAFRALVEAWCWCGRNPQVNGSIPKSSWTKRGTPAARRELLAAGLFTDDGADGVQVHDWESWQRTWDEIRESKQEKADAGAFGAHKRWHVDRKQRAEGCEFCYPKAAAMENA